MQKVIIICLLVLHSLAADAWQPPTTDPIQFFLKQDQEEEAQYAEAVRLLQAAVEKNPDDANYHYYLGYAIDRINCANAELIPKSQLSNTLIASTCFEKTISLSPKSEIELYKSDPYSKISAIWGSLAFAYLNRQQTDSALWAFKQGEQRGGFLQPVLAYAREMLMNVDTNGILIGVGDNFTFPLNYLQTVEGFRKDVQVIDANLLGTSWYPNLLLRNERLFSFTEASLDLIDYKPWNSQYVSLTSPLDTFSWVMKPSYMGQYLLRGDRILIDMLQQQWQKRPFYFMNPVDSSFSLFLDEHLKVEGILCRLDIGAATLPDEYNGYQYNFLSRYKVNENDRAFFEKSPDAVRLVNGYRYAYILKIAELFSAGQAKSVKKLYDQMKNNIPEAVLPMYSDAVASYFKQLEDYFSE